MGNNLVGVVQCAANHCDGWVAKFRQLELAMRSAINSIVYIKEGDFDLHGSCEKIEVTAAIMVAILEGLRTISIEIDENFDVKKNPPGVTIRVFDSLDAVCEMKQRP